MAHPIRSVVALKLSRTAGASPGAVAMPQDDDQQSLPAGGPGLDAGGYIDLGASVTSATITVLDDTGSEIYSGTTTEDLVVAATAHGVTMPLTANLTASQGSGSVVVYWWVKK